MLKKYGPALVAVAFALLTALAASLTDNRVDPTEWVQVGIQGATVAGVWLVPAFPAYPLVKTGVAIVLAVLNALLAVVVDGLTGAEVVNLLIAGVGVVALRLTPPPIHDPDAPTRVTAAGR